MDAQKELQEAVRNNDTSAAERILQECMALEDMHRYAIIIRCYETALNNKCLPMVKLLLSQDVVSYYSSEQLMRAAVESDFMEGVQFLHSKGGRLYKGCINDCARNNSPEMLKYILGHNDLDTGSQQIDNINQQLRPTEPSALYCCIHGNRSSPYYSKRDSDKVLECIKLLVGAGADVEGNYYETPIKLAADYGLVTTVTYLAQNGANVDIRNYQGTLLHCLAKSKGVSDSYDECVQILIRQGVNINKVNLMNETPLYAAVDNSNERMVKSLLNIQSTRDRCDVNKAVENGITPLMLGVIRAETVLVKLLIIHGANVNKTAEDGVTPLMISVRQADLILVKLLIDHGANVNSIDKKEKCVLDYCFLSYRKPSSTDIFKVLLEAGADMHTYRHNLLIKTINEQMFEMASVLIEHGINVNTEDGNGNKPLGLAVTSIKANLDNTYGNKHPGRVVTFEEANLDNIYFNTEDIYENKRLVLVDMSEEANLDSNDVNIHAVTCDEANIELVTLLVSKDDDINHQNRRGETALHKALRSWELEDYKLEKVISILLESKINVNISDFRGETALMAAVKMNNWGTLTSFHENGRRSLLKICKLPKFYFNELTVRSITERLLKAGADVNMCDNNGRTALMEAASNNHKAVLKVLLEAGADINLSDNSGRTALMAAAGNCDRYIVKFLINAGADVNKTDRNGRSAIHHVILGADTPGRNGRSALDDILHGTGESDHNVRSTLHLVYGAYLKNWVYCIKLLLIGKCHMSLDTPVNGKRLFKTVMDTDNADLLWYLVTENCSITGLNLQKVIHKLQFPDTQKLSKILFENGAQIRKIKRSEDNQQQDEFRDFCKSRSLKARCRREIRKCIGSGISSKVTQLGLPQCLEDYVVMKDLIPEKYFNLVINDQDDEDDSDKTSMADIYKRFGILLNKAVGCRDYTTASLLIENGVDVNTEDEHGDKPLGLAARHNDPELVILLTSKNGNINHQNRKGETALHKSAVHGRVNRYDSNSFRYRNINVEDLSVTEILLKAGADVNLCDNNGSTALMEASRACNRSGLQCLLKAGADVNKTDKDGNSAIHNLMLGSRRSRKWINCLKLLLTNKYHGSLDIPGENGKTLFEWLLYKHETDLIWYLVTENCSLGGFDLGGFRDKFEFPDTLMLSKILFESGAPKPETECLILRLDSDNLSSDADLDDPMPESSDVDDNPGADLDDPMPESSDVDDDPGADLDDPMPESLDIDDDPSSDLDNPMPKSPDVDDDPSSDLDDPMPESSDVDDDPRSDLDHPTPERSEFIKELDDFDDFRKSRSLQSRCRREIRNCIGSGIRSKITQLGLPPCVEDYVLMKDLIPEKYFTLVINDKDDKSYESTGLYSMAVGRRFLYGNNDNDIDEAEGQIYDGQDEDLFRNILNKRTYQSVLEVMKRSSDENKRFFQRQLEEIQVKYGYSGDGYSEDGYYNQHDEESYTMYDY